MVVQSPCGFYVTFCFSFCIQVLSNARLFLENLLRFVLHAGPGFMALS